MAKAQPKDNNTVDQTVNQEEQASAGTGASEATPTEAAEAPAEEKPSLPYALRRELEEISKNTGKEFDLSLPVEELEAICNGSNYPPNAWRDRWANQ